eukprot:jgi/Bigna1/84952/estExt_fgenesh1_pg.C_10458
MASDSAPEALLEQMFKECQAVAATHQKTYTNGLLVVNGMINRLEKALGKATKRPLTLDKSEKLCDSLLDGKPHIKLAREFKELYGSVQQLGRTIDRNLKRASDAFENQTEGVRGQVNSSSSTSSSSSSSSSTCKLQSAAGPSFSSKELARVIIHSLMRRGKFETADLVARELKLDGSRIVPTATRKAFEHMHHCRLALEKKNIVPVLEWTQQQQELLEKDDSSTTTTTMTMSTACTSSSSEKEGGGNDSRTHLMRSRIRDLKFQLLRLRYLQLVQEDIRNPTASSSSSSSSSSQQAQRNNTPAASHANGNGSSPSSSSIANSSSPLPSSTATSAMSSKLHVSNGSSNSSSSSSSSSSRCRRRNSSSFSKPIAFARRWFVEFARDRQRDIERLAGALLFASDIPNSPYRDLYSDEAWQNVMQHFESTFCRAHGFAGRDPLMVATLASDIALPKRAKYTAVVRRSSGTSLLDRKDDALPEINLGKKMQFHSTFVCPISKILYVACAMVDVVGVTLPYQKELATQSNPPVLLTCGHAISRDAMLKMTRTRRSNLIKCPTCPVESNVSNVTTMIF